MVKYSIAKYKIFDKKVISRIDPTICDVLAQFAAKYDYEEAQLIYDYAMSYSNNVEAEWDNIPSITYNFSYFENANLSKKDKKVIERICKNARKNMNIDVIGNGIGLSKIKYLFKKLFATNKAEELPEVKY